MGQNARGPYCMDHLGQQRLWIGSHVQVLQLKADGHLSHLDFLICQEKPSLWIQDEPPPKGQRPKTPGRGAKIAPNFQPQNPTASTCLSSQLVNLIGHTHLRPSHQSWSLPTPVLPNYATAPPSPLAEITDTFTVTPFAFRWGSEILPWALVPFLHAQKTP